MTTTAPELAPAQTFELPKPPSGDAAAARRMATALRNAADEILSAERQAHAVLEDAYTSWTGCSASASRHPLIALDVRTRQVSAALREAADRLDHYAGVLARAHHQHHWSWGKIARVAAVVAVTATVVVVTVGAAAPAAAAADAALVGAEVASTTAAVVAAGGAAAEAAEAVTVAVRALQLLRGVATFLRPQVFATAGVTDYQAFRQVRDTGHLDVGALVSDAATNIASGAAGMRLAGPLSRLGASATNPVVAWMLPKLAVSSGWGATEAATEVTTTGHVDPWEPLVAAGYAFGGTVVADLLPRAGGSTVAWANAGGERLSPEQAARFAAREQASLEQLAQTELRIIHFKDGLDDADRLAAEHPGTRPEDWEKVSSRACKDGKGHFECFEVHSYRNRVAGLQVEFKTKFPRFASEVERMRAAGFVPGEGGSWERWLEFKAQAANKTGK